MGAAEKARKAIERFYTDSCNVYEEKSVRDPDTKLTKRDWVKVNEEPYKCRLSFKAKRPSGSMEGAGTEEQQIELFMAPEAVVKAGSKLEVTRNGTTMTYKNSGVPAIYDTHQEILLEKEGEWA